MSNNTIINGAKQAMYGFRRNLDKKQQSMANTEKKKNREVSLLQRPEKNASEEDTFIEDLVLSIRKTGNA